MTVPADFAEEVRQANADRDAAKLLLISWEVQSLPWQVEGSQFLADSDGPAGSQPPVDCVILFTGHRIDSGDRTTPRFPSSAEPAAREAILEALRQQFTLGQDSVLGVAGGANGGDILFLESCRTLGIPAQMLLAIPPDQFVRASVKSDSGDWVGRFQKLADASPPVVLAKSKTLPAWLSAKTGYDIWQRNNAWLIAYALAQKPAHFTLVALWDGDNGDGPGGTGNMVAMARQHGAQLVHLDTRRLFHLA